jgi:hypothetical protein
VRFRGIEAFVDAPPADAILEAAGSVTPMIPGRPGDAHEVRSPMKAAARTAMSTGFSIVLTRRRSREASGNLPRTASTAAARPAGCGGMLAKGVYKHRKPSVLVGRVASLPWRARGRAQMAEALGVPMMSAALNARAASAPVYPR